MKKVIVFVFVCFAALFFCQGTSSAKDIENISTVIGNYSYDGFVPTDAALFNGDLVVCDSSNHRISTIDLVSSKVSGKVGSFGNGENEFKYPKAVVSHGKDLFVCDSGNSRISIYKDGLAFLGEISLKNTPVDIAAVGDNLYILYEDGLLIDVFNIPSKTFKEQIKVLNRVLNISSFEENLVLLGQESYTYDLNTHEYTQRSLLNNCISFFEYGGNGYALFDGEYTIMGKDLEISKTFNIDKGNGILAGKEGVFVCDAYSGMVNMYREGSLVSSYGRERPAAKMRHITARGSLMAVANGRDIVLYKNGRQVFSLACDNVADIKIIDGNLFVLKPNSISQYLINKYGDESVSLTLDKSLDANSAYTFTSMDSDGKNIYITEKSSGKVLKVDVGLKVFSTVVNHVKNPSAIACGEDKLYVAEDDSLGVYNISGQKLMEQPGKYARLSYNKVLFTIADGAKTVTKLDGELKVIDEITHDGYFENLGDIEAREYGLFICDYDRNEVMVYTKENLELSNDNITVNGTAFNGKTFEGQSITVKVSGAGMMNHLPDTGDVRYYPSSCGIDSQVSMTEDKGRFYGSINMQNVGNYTLKVIYKKQMFMAGSWQDVKTADGVLTYDLPVAVLPVHTASQQDANIVWEYLSWLKRFLCGL